MWKPQLLSAPQWDCILQCFLSPQENQRLLHHAYRHPGSEVKTRACNWDKLNALGEAQPPVRSHAPNTGPGQSAKWPWSCSSSAAPQFSWLLLFTGLGASLEWQASTLAVDGVMWYALQLHRAHRLAETCGAALPGELFHLTQPFKGHVCVADNLCEQKTNRPPLPSFQFLWLFFFFSSP